MQITVGGTLRATNLTLQVKEFDTDANINLQMNYWFAELTDMDVVKPLFDYIEVRILAVLGCLCT